MEVISNTDESGVGEVEATEWGIGCGESRAQAIYSECSSIKNREMRQELEEDIGQEEKIFSHGKIIHVFMQWRVTQQRGRNQRCRGRGETC